MKTPTPIVGGAYRVLDSGELVREGEQQPAEDAVLADEPSPEEKPLPASLRFRSRNKEHAP